MDTRVTQRFAHTPGMPARPSRPETELPPTETVHLGEEHHPSLLGRIGLAGLSLLGIGALAGCNVSAPPAQEQSAPERHQEVEGSDWHYLREANGEKVAFPDWDSGVGSSINDHGQFMVAGTQGILYGQKQADGSMPFHRLKDAQGQPVTFPDWDSGVGVSVNNRGQFVVGSTQAVLYGQVNADGTITYHQLPGVTFPDWDSGVGASLNDNGQFVVAGTQGVYTGRIDEQGVARFSQLPGVAFPDWDSGVGASVNNKGQFMVASTQSVLFGQLNAEGGVTAQNQLKNPDGSAVTFPDWDSGVGVSLNDSGQFVLAGTQGVYTGRLDGQTATFSPLKDGQGKPVTFPDWDSGVGASVNNSGQFLVGGTQAVITGQLSSEGAPTWRFLTDTRGQQVTFPDWDSGVGVSVNNQGDYLIGGTQGIIAGHR